MIIGIPKEVLDNENRVGATPAMVKALTENGHQVLVETLAGDAIGFTDGSYAKAGATIVESPRFVYEAEMIVKVKEPQFSEYPLLREDQILFAFLHLAPNPTLTKELVNSKVVAIAYETVTDRKGKLPLLVPMSEIAGRLSIQVGATALQMYYGGKGVLLGGVPGVLPGNVVIIGGGAAGTEAARMAMGLGADVTVIDNDMKQLRDLDRLFGPRLKTLFSSSITIENTIAHADLVIGAVLIPGKTAPKLITREMIKKMEPGSVFVDVAIDQGGCSETSRPTRHSNPTYVVDDVIHYCVVNMPGTCARTSTLALTNATTNYVLKIAKEGYRVALSEDPCLRMGLNICKRRVTNEYVAFDLGYDYTPPEQIL